MDETTIRVTVPIGIDIHETVEMPWETRVYSFSVRFLGRNIESGRGYPTAKKARLAGERAARHWAKNLD